jgi:hypothetical protein
MPRFEIIQTYHLHGSSAMKIHALVPGDAKQPGDEGGFVTIVLDMLERLQERLLYHLLGIGRITDKPVSQPQDARVEITYLFRVELKISCFLARQFSWRTKQSAFAHHRGSSLSGRVP